MTPCPQHPARASWVHRARCAGLQEVGMGGASAEERSTAGKSTAWPLCHMRSMACAAWQPWQSLSSTLTCTAACAAAGTRGRASGSRSGGSTAQHKPRLNHNNKSTASSPHAAAHSRHHAPPYSTPLATAGVTPLPSAEMPSERTTRQPVASRLRPSGPASCCRTLMTSTQLVSTTPLRQGMRKFVHHRP